MSDVLAHYGKKGMRWGVRNDTPATGQRVKKKGKRLSDMTDDELNKLVTRLEKEKRYKTLMKEMNNERQTADVRLLKWGASLVAAAAFEGGKNALAPYITEHLKRRLPPVPARP